MLRLRRKPARKNSRVDWQKASDIDERLTYLIKKLEFDWLDVANIHCFRSENSKARAYARIWGFSKIWQIALDQSPGYCVEVLSENFDRLNQEKQDKVLLHELAHIPKNFSGALIPHTHKRKGSFHDKLETMIAMYDKMI